MFVGICFFAFLVKWVIAYVQHGKSFLLTKISVALYPFFMKKYDVIIIGGGIVGLASAFSLLRQQPLLKIAVLEKESAIGMHQTGHNSGVIHSGIYYRPESLKAVNCRQGVSLLLQFCLEKEIPFQQCGKVIVVTKEEEIPRLQELERRGKANGVQGLEMIGADRLRDIEPHVSGLCALYSPTTGIIDFTKVAKAYAEEIMHLGGQIYCSQKIERFVLSKEECVLLTATSEYHANYIINCAGLHADRIAHSMDREISRKQILPFRGEYYELIPEKRDFIRGLVYPVPDPKFPFLGVHLSRTMHGNVEAGPNAVLALSREGYSKSDFNLKDCLDYLTYKGFWKMATAHWKVGLYEIMRSYSKKRFLKDLQRLVPVLEESDLIPGESGVRSQLVLSNGKIYDDFSIVDTPRAIHVLSAPSPAATASLAIGCTLAQQLIKKTMRQQRQQFEIQK